MILSSSGQAGVVGSPHDFSTTTPGPWTRDNSAYTSGGIAPSGVCSACHIPHSAKYAPLWPRDLSNYDNAFLLDGSGGSTGKPNYRRQTTNQCYDCHDYHQTTPERIDDLPNFSRFSNVSSGHKPQNIAFGFTKPATGKDLNSTMKEDIPAGSVSGYYENAPPFQTQPTRNYGATDNTRRPVDNATLSRAGGHYYKTADPNTSTGIYKGDKLPCSDCHDPHAWDSGGAWQAFFRKNWPSGSPVASRLSSWTGRASTYMANPQTPTGATRSDLDSRTLCEACHGSADPGNPPVTYPQINDSNFPNTYTNNIQIVAAPATVSQHFNSKSQAACVSCHNHNSVNASCNSCHGAASDTAGMPAIGDNGVYHTDANNVIGTRGGDNTAHFIHVNYLVNKRGIGRSSACYVCHKGGGSQESHPGNPANQNFKSGTQPTASYVQVSLDNTGVALNVWNGAGTGPTYSGAPGQAADATNGWKTCSSTNCHFALSPSWSGKKQITGDTVTVSGGGTAPASAAQNATDDFLRFRLQVTGATQDNTASFTAVAVTLTGTLAVADIDNVIVYRDANADNTWQATDNVVGFASGPSASPVTVTFGSAQAVTTSPSPYYFVALKLKSTADWTKTVGAELTSNAAITLAAPDAVATTNFPISSANVSITDAADTLTVASDNTNALSTILQGGKQEFLRLSPSVNQDNVAWTGLTVTKTGTATFDNASRVSVYRDANADNVWQNSDTEVAGVDNPTGVAVTVTFTTPQTITTAAQPKYFVVYTMKATATAGATIGAQIADNNAILRQGTADTTALTGTASSGNATIQVPADTVTVSGDNTAPASIAQNATDDFLRFRLQVTGATQDNIASFTAVAVTLAGTLAVADIDNVIVYRDANADNTWQATDNVVGFASGPSASPVTVTFGSAQAVTTSPSPYYFVALKLKSTADWTKTVGAELTSNAAITLTAPDAVSTANFPISSSNAQITDVADQLTLTGTDVAPANITAGTGNAFLRLVPSVNQDGVVWTGLVVTKTGTAPITDLDNVIVYKDANADNVWQATDNVVGFASNPAASPVTVTFTTPQTITTAAQPSYFVVLSPKSTATAGNTVGASIAADTDIQIQGTTDTRLRAGTTASGNATVQSASAPFPATNYIVTINSGTALGWGNTNMTTGTAKTTQNDNTLLVKSGEDITNTYYGTTNTTERTAYNAIWNTALGAGSNTTITAVTFNIRVRKAHANDRIRLQLMYFNPSGGAATSIYDTGLVDPGGAIGTTTLFTHNSPAISVPVPDGMKLGLKVNFQQGSTTAMRVYVATGTSGQNTQATISGTNSTGVAPAPPRDTGGTTGIACNSCHQFGPDDATAGYKDSNQYYYASPGSHAKHGVSLIAGTDPVADNALNTCTLCHAAATNTFGYDHMDGTDNVRSGSIGTRTAGPAYADDGTYDAPSRTCSNVYCHAGRPTPQATGQSWGYGSSTCGVCHAVTPPYGKHAIHNNGNVNTTPSNGSSAGNYDFSCYYCHPSGTAHVNYPVSGVQAAQVSFSGTLGAQTLSGTYTAGGTIAGWDNVTTQGLSWTNGSCATYCHTNGQGGAALVTPTWNHAGFPTATCVGCHDTRGAATTLSTRHQKHTDNTAGTGYNFTCDECHAATVANDSRTTLHATTGRPNHVDGNLTVQFSTTLRATAIAISGTYTQGVDNCANTYCHSDGSSIKNGGTIQANSVLWGTAGPLACNACHGNPPAYASAANRANSHTAHSSYGCQTCHSQTTTTGTTITAADNHVNGVYNVSSTGTSVFTFTYNASGSTCAFTSGCHGTSTVTWGGTLTGGCAACHGGASDVNNFGYNDGTLAIIQMTGGWDTTGHGRTTAFPSTASGNPAPNDGTRFGSGATPNCTNYCHDSGQPHTDNSAGSNFFRLATGVGASGRTAITQSTANNICNQCHTTGGVYNAQATKDIVTAHYGAKHDNSTKNAGNFCWDCHEPHGDANDYMIQAAVASRTDMSTAPGGIGIPLSTANVQFLKSGGSNATAYDWGDYVGTVVGDTNRLCRVCHDTTVNHFNTSTWDSNHNPGTRCTQCHGDTYKHDIDFRGIGTCVGCHSGAQGSSPARRQVTGASGDFNQATHHVTNYVDNTSDGAVQNVDCSKCHWEGYLTGDTILTGRTPAKQGDTNPAFHWADDGNNATAKFVQVRVWSGTAAPSAYSNIASGTATEWRNGAANNPVTEAINLNRHCLGCHSSTIGAGIPFSDLRSPRVRSWDGTDIGTKYLRNGAANTRLTHQYSNTTYNVVPPINKALSAHYDLQNNRRGVATTGAWSSDDTAGVAGTATGTVACFDCHNSHGSPVVGTATLPLVSYAGNASLNAGLSNANVGGLLKATTAGVSGYTTTYSPVANATWNWSAGSASCFDCHVGSTAGGTPPKTYVNFGRTAANLVAGYYDPVDWAGTVNAGQGVWDNRRWSGSFAFKANNIVVTHFKNDATVRALQTTPTNQLNGLCSRCHDPHGVTTNTTQVSNANYGTPLLKGTWMTSPYFEDRPGEVPSGASPTQRLATSNNWSFNSRVYIGSSARGYAPRVIPYRDWNRPSIVGGGYGTTGGGVGADGFFIDENTFGLTLTGGTVAFDMFGSTTPGGTNNVWRNLWNGGYGVTVNININRITETNAQFAGLCERCHTPASLVNTASKAANIITHAHRTVKGWDALAGGPAAADIFKNFHINNTTNSGTFSQMLHGAWAWNNMAANFSDYRVIEDPTEPWAGFPFQWGVNLNRTGGQFVNNYIQTNYHQFLCSKCHAPHTSRLPRLLRTNCLDTGTVRGVNGGNSNWGTNGSWIQRHSTNATNAYINRFRVTSNSTFRWSPARALRCHQDAYAINGTAANDTRWNDLTPW